MDEYIDYYIAIFKEEPVVDNILRNYILDSKWEEALLYCFETENINLFKMIYLFTGCKFPIQTISDIEQKIAQDCGTICKPRWNGKWMELEIDKVVLSEENNKKYGAKLTMVRFILNCRSYSRHIYTGCKFYYFFKLDKYKDRILDILREF
jgi:hypothetical protein